MKFRQFAKGLVLASLISWGVNSNARAAEEAKDAQGEDKWQFISAPFLWASGIEGDLTMHGRTVDVDIGFDDLFDVTDYGFQTYLELRKEKFGFYAAPSFMRLAGDAETKHIKADFDQDFWLVEGGGFYNLLHQGGERPFTIDALAGVRYWNVKTDVDIRGKGPLGLERSFTDRVEVTDPVVGVRLHKYVTKKLSLSLRGDVGGFDLSENTSVFSWQAVGLVGYDFNKRFSIFGGYRVLGIETESGSGSKESGLHLRFNGALLGLQIRM